MKAIQVGYVRVSSLDQNTDRQLDGIALDKVFTDKCSGKDTHRPQLALALDFLREGDTLVVHSMDRLARNVDDLRHIVKILTTDGIAVKFVKENLTFAGDDSPMNNLLLTLLGAVAEFERAMIHERQREGIALAKAKGVYTGRKQQLTPQQVGELTARVGHGEPKAQIARDLGISRNTLYNYIERLR
ncbi:recombinase family protein [Collimonas sp. OK412]|uniref:recombinase family protein n=1 Tax=Collimonas sp. (strain OK412) TaxID=1801619 RepID=UPI0008E55B22|nr:recombinase family protein [Collimonas sp. OK412]SFC62130.1 Site-specific DNA recombinase [Collimonas sp. OK412]